MHTDTEYNDWYASTCTHTPPSVKLATTNYAKLTRLLMNLGVVFSLSLSHAHSHSQWAYTTVQCTSTCISPKLGSCCCAVPLFDHHPQQQYHPYLFIFVIYFFFFLIRLCTHIANLPIQLSVNGVNSFCFSFRKTHQRPFCFFLFYFFFFEFNACTFCFIFFSTCCLN